MKVLLVTGGSGFVGSNFINYFFRRNKNYIIINLDNLTHSQNINNLKEFEKSPRYHFVKGSILNQDLVNYVIKRHRPDYIINFACETNVNKSLTNPASVFETNVLGTLTLLESAKYFWSKHNYEGNRFIQVSTTEVYGSNSDADNYFNEESNISPQNPYAISKASSDMLVKSFVTHFNFPAIISRCCKNYGPYQYLEEFIPSCIKSAIENKTIALSEENNKHREWLYVLDHCTALVRILFYGKIGEIYNIGSGTEYTDMEIANKILKILGKPEIKLESDNSKIPEVHHAVNSYKIRNNLSWGHKYNMDNGLFETVHWYILNKSWWM
ncbi:dTDP-glucose 4,6-dehydratase [Acetivibrio clariflavus]|uniref:dTDP-D-glucose 4,6-dehydratase n=1 Tax=Acetivibrio clariflavus (strain DSM 19732 / NBRC 101661 / EBR45) TaxID=720554 RepID=G8M195_ACECE|nr:GDP-mannose 4,6-dehydratase [Acetivibrio clariflavus]AEV68071.1 dTDP-D-glucose 4,6-dehydratase [Acetivibrio clariflavus DSM 19732]